MIPEIGDKIGFVPTAYNYGPGTGSVGTPEAKLHAMGARVLGTVTKIHHGHRWFMLSYPTQYFGIQSECFKFDGGGGPHDAQR